MKRNFLIYLILGMGIFLTIRCKKEAEASTEVTPTFDLASAKTSIEARHREFEKAFNTKDSVALANCYCIDAKFMAPNDKAIEGKPAIQKLFTAWLKADTPKITIKDIDLWGNETNLTAEDSWTMSDKDGKVLDQGKSIEVYKMEGGTWKILRDCWNSDIPPHLLRLL